MARIYDVVKRIADHVTGGVHILAQPAQFPPGLILLYGADVAPTGWLLCAGAAVSRATYATLFGIIGTAYGAGDGVTTFNVPNFLGRTVIGTGAGAGLTARARGNSGGGETHLLTVPEIPAHAHDYLTVSGGAGGSDSGPNNAAGSRTTTNTGGGGAHNNMQPYAVATYIIKT